MRIQIYGCRGSIPRPNKEMARYGGNTPCIEVISANDHRVILDLGSGAYDLGSKVLGEMFAKNALKKKQQEEEEEKEREKKNSTGGGEDTRTEEEGEDSKMPDPKSSSSTTTKNTEQKPGGSIFLTHTHWDHIQGLPFFVPLYLPQFEWKIYGPRGVAKSLQEILSGQMQHDYFPVRLGDMSASTRYLGLCEDIDGGVWLDGEKDEKASGGVGASGSREDDEKKCDEMGEGIATPTSSLRVTTKYLNHTVLTLGYKLEEYVELPRDPSASPASKPQRKKRVSMAYITDHEPYDHSLAGGGFVSHNFDSDSMKSSLEAHPATSTSVSNSIKDTHPTADQSHAQFFANVDVLIHDCQYYFAEYAKAPVPKENWGHSTVEYVVDVAFYSNVKQLLLFHHDPQRTDDQMDILVEAARKRANELEDRYFGEGEDSGRIRMKVDAAMEGNVYELDPYTLGLGDPGECIDIAETNGKTMHEESADTANVTEKRTVVLGFYQSDAATISDMLKSSKNINVKLLQSSDDILQYAREKQPSVIVLDQYVFGCSALEICQEIREMGEWGKQVPLLVVTSSARNSDTTEQQLENNEDQLTAEDLHVEDYIKEPYSPAYLLTRVQMSILRVPLRWRRAPPPKMESLRLATLTSTGLLDSDPEERFDRITRLARTMFNVPITLVSLVDKERQWFKSTCGLDAKETPRDHAFCAHAILEDDIMVVPDALQDDRFADNPLVSGGPKIRFYAGCPLRIPMDNSENQAAIGTICIIDSKPRDLRDDERRALKDFGAMVEKEITDDQQRKRLGYFSPENMKK